MVLDIPNRDTLLKHFLKGCFSKLPETIKPMYGGGAGSRGYYRIVDNDISYVVMDCSPSCCHLQPFIDIAGYLRDIGFSTPKIIKQDLNQGFLILEDFGNISIKDYLLKGHGQNIT